MRLRDFSSGQNMVRGGWCAWGWGERHLNFLIIFFFFCKISTPPFLLTALLRIWHCFFQRDPVTLSCVCFYPCPEMAPAHTYCHEIRRRTFAERRHLHHVHPTHPHLLQSDFNFVNCYEGSLIAERGGCQSPTVTRFLLSHFTALLCLTLDTQAWRSPVRLVGYCNKMTFLSYTKC